MDPQPDKDTIEYIEWLLTKATPDTDAAMVVDWVPHIRNLLSLVKDTRREFALLKEDYDKVLAERRKEQWKPSGR